MNTWTYLGERLKTKFGKKQPLNKRLEPYAGKRSNSFLGNGIAFAVPLQIDPPVRYQL